jgi:hypothetical protein
MYGATGCGTGFHLDWANAVNIAFAVDESTISSVLAVWSFMDPTVHENKTLKDALDQWCVLNLPKYGKFMDETASPNIFNQQVNVQPTNKLPQKALLTYDDLMNLNNHLLEAAAHAKLTNNGAYITHIFQKHGDVVNVHVGWAHQVVNLQRCIKYAFDYSLPEHAKQCIFTNNALHARYPFVNARDYRGVGREIIIAARCA